MEYTNSQICELIDEHIHSERDREIMKRRMVDGICYEPLAEEFDLSTVQVKRIVRREQNKIARYVNDT
jgi:Mor family transcriptional regulator